MSATWIRRGNVVSAGSDVVNATLPLASVGESVYIHARGGRAVPATVSRIATGTVTLTAYAPLDGVAVVDVVETSLDAQRLDLGTPLLGRAIDAGGAALDGGGIPRGRRAAVLEPPISAARRTAITEPLWTGIRSIDALLTIGRGARIGIFGPPAAGKSTLIEMLVRNARADAIVVGLIGERGREAATWIEHMTPTTTLVIAPLDRSPSERVRAAHVALAQGSQLRRRGLSVLVVLDSLARFAAAARELGVLNGETVGRGGFPPSVFAAMAKLLERGGNCDGGSLTLIVTVLSDGPDDTDPLSEAARAALDGHIVLSRQLAQSGHYPAIDIPKSASRTMHEVIAPEHRAAAQTVRGAIALLDETREVRELGFRPENPLLERAVILEPKLREFLQQGIEGVRPTEALPQLNALAEALRNG